MNFLEKKPIYYKRYADDTFLIFSNEQDSISFFEHMNCQHPNISFTVETENDDCLPSDHKKQRLQIKETLCINQCQAYKSLNVNIKSFECTLW